MRDNYKHTNARPRLERAADADVDASRRRRRVPLPSCPHAAPTVTVNGNEVAGDDVGRQLAAERRLDVAARETCCVQAWPTSANTAACSVCRKSGHVPTPRCGRASGQR